MADYRDDHDALHERVTTLQQELDGARTDLERERATGSHDERVEALGAEIRSARQSVARMESELEALRGPNGKRGASKNRVALVVGGAVAAGLVVAAVAAGSRPPPPARYQVVATATPIVPSTASALPFTATAPAATAAVEARTVKATWAARVRLSSGTPAAAAGSACSIDTNIGEQALLPALVDLSVRCGDRVFYDSTKATYGMRHSGGSVGQIAGKDRGTLVFDVNYTDTGTGDSPQIRIDGRKGTVLMWHDYPDAFRLELTFARPSAPVASEPLGGLGSAALDRSARVEQVRGRATPAVGTICSVHAMPNAERRCYVSVDCGAGGALFGVAPFSALTTCNPSDVVAGKVTILDLDDPNSSADEGIGGDPRLHLFTPPGHVRPVGARDVLTVADEPKNASPWSVELVLADADASR